MLFTLCIPQSSETLSCFSKNTSQASIFILLQVQMTDESIQISIGYNFGQRYSLLISKDTLDQVYVLSFNALLFLLNRQSTYNNMQNNFKNPFQLDEEDTIITLDQNYTNQQSKPQTFNANPPVSTTASSEGSMFNPLNPSLAQDQTLFSQDQQIPLLQDIGIDVGLIKRRITAIITLGEVDKELIQSPDLSGPLMIAFLLGFLLLLGGKIHFSDIQTVFIIGNIIMYILFNFMVKGEQQVEITLYSVTSYLGYSLLPMLILAILGIFLSLKTGFGIFASLILAGWSSYTSGALMSLALNRSEGRILIMYPLFLFYLSFALIIIF